MCSLFRNRLFLYYPLFSFFFVVFFNLVLWYCFFFFGSFPQLSLSCFFLLFCLCSPSYFFRLLYVFSSYLFYLTLSILYHNHRYLMFPYSFSSVYLLFSCLIFPLLPLFNSPSYLFFVLSPVSAYNLRLTLCILYASSQFITLLSSPLYVFALLSLLLPALSPVFRLSFCQAFYSVLSHIYSSFCGKGLRLVLMLLSMMCDFYVIFVEACVDLFLLLMCCMCLSLL